MKPSKRLLALARETRPPLALLSLALSGADKGPATHWLAFITRKQVRIFC